MSIGEDDDFEGAGGPTEEDVRESRSVREHGGGLDGGFYEGSGGARATVTDQDRAEARTFAPEARKLILEFEISSKAAYKSTYQFPTWPGGQSGVTIGIGYDLGFCSRDEYAQAWQRFLPEADFQALAKAIGLTSASAEAAVAGLKHIMVPWDEANRVFDEITLPLYIARTKRVFPGANRLDPRSFGALVSLVYNRGESTRGPNRTEMLAIQQAMAAGRYEAIPEHFRTMTRLWPKMRGLIRRRKAEARLFEDGLITRKRELLAQVQLLPPSPGAPQTILQEAAAPLFERSSEHDGDGTDIELDYQSDTLEPPSTGHLESVPAWIGVQWVKDDRLSPDYRHLLDSDRVDVRDASFQFTFEDLELLLRANAFHIDTTAPQESCILFGIRGAVLDFDAASPGDRHGQVERHALRLRTCRPDHQNFRCVIGVYNRNTRRLSGFTSSTVPNRGAVHKCKTTGRDGNILAPGHYRYVVGAHSKGRFKGCLRQHEPMAVLRTRKDLIYDVRDVWDITVSDAGWPMDNIHPAFTDKTYGSADFSSFGCQVIRGTFRNGAYTDQFAQFRKAMGLRPPGTDNGRVFSYVLLTGDEAAIASMLRQQGGSGDYNLVTEKLGRLRQGSSGPLVDALQVRLNLQRTGSFGAVTKAALIEMQRGVLGEGEGDGIYSPAVDAALKFGIFAPVPVVMAGLPEGLAEAVDQAGPVAGMPAAGAQRTVESVLYDIGRRFEIAAVNPNAMAMETLPQSEAVSAERWSELVERGRRLVSRHERLVFDALFNGGADGALEQEKLLADLRGLVGADVATAVPALSGMISSALMTAPAISRPVAEIIYSRLSPILRNEAGDPPDVAVETLKLRWGARLGANVASGANPASMGVPAIPAAPCENAIKYRAVIEQITGLLGTDPIPFDQLHTSFDVAFGLMAQSFEAVEEDQVLALMKTLKRKRQFGFLTKVGDRAITLFPRNLMIKKFYAQGLIELGQVNAAIHWLSAEIEQLGPTPPNEALAEYKEFCGLLGRANKQIYVNHVRSSNAAPAVKAAYKPYLKASLDAYARIYRGSPRGIEHWHGINVASLLRIADEDGHDDLLEHFEWSSRDLAKQIIETQRPLAARHSGDQTWQLASIAEAYMLLDDVKNAEQYVSKYLASESADQFEIASTARQFEEVLRIDPAARDGSDIAKEQAAVLGLLKAKQIATKEGRFTLDGDSLKQQVEIAKSQVYREVYETVTPGGSFLELGLLAKALECAQSVAAVTDLSGKTWGTGFLLRGSDLCARWDDGIYLVTNSHVLSCPDWGAEHWEKSPLRPDTARVVLQAAGSAALKLEPRAMFLSRPKLFDVAVVRIKDPPGNLKTVQLFPEERDVQPENPASPTVPAPSTVCIIGCPLGGPLSLSLVGILEGAKGVLVDVGGRNCDGDPTYLHYRAPTQQGNSGSPVFDSETWTVIGVHHEGFDPFHGRPRLGGRDGANHANEGISIHSIRRAIAKLVH